jgi:MFS family permease
MTADHSSLLTPLRHRVYRHLFAAQVIALIGTGLSTVALALLAYDLAGGNAGLVLGSALALKMIAYVGIAPIIGGYAHRLPRRALLISLDVIRALLVLALPFVDAIWQIYVLIFLLNACSAGFTPVFQATIPDILPQEKTYTRALSLSRLAYDLENLLSPTLAALLLIFLDYHHLFACNSIAFVVSAWLVWRISLPLAAAPERQGGVIASVSFGIRSYLATPRLRGLLLLSLAVSAAGAMMIVNTVVYVRAWLGGSETDTAVALAAAGCGSMLAALVLPKLLERFAERPLMLSGAGLLAIGLSAGLLQPGFMALLPVWFVLGMGSSLVQTPIGRLLRRSCQPADRSAFFSAQFALSHLCWLLSYPLAGWAGSSLGLPASFAILAGIVVVTTLLAARVWPADDKTALEHTHEAVEHVHRHVHDEHHQHTHEGWEGPEPHSHAHCHRPIRHTHRFVIDHHHRHWPV